MGKRLRSLVLLLGLVGCSDGLPDSLPVGFINQTHHADVDLWTTWKKAQQNLAEKIDLNPLQRSAPTVPADIRPGDPRALHSMPHQLRVAAEPDVPSSVLFAVTGVLRPDPTGLIACPQPCNVRYAAGYSWYERRVTKYAASWEFVGDNFAIILQYEFENQILSELGYNMRWR